MNKILIILIQVIFNLYKYDLEKGKNFWYGSGVAVHYYNQFIFGSLNIVNKTGTMVNYEKLTSLKNFDLHLELVIDQIKRKKVKGSHGGFMFWLTKEEIFEDTNINLKYSRFGSNFDMKGYYFMIKIEESLDKNTNIKMIYGKKTKKYNLDDIYKLKDPYSLNCDIYYDNNKKLVLFLKKNEKNELLVHSNNKEGQYTNCPTISNFKEKNFKVMMSYSQGKNQKLQINIKSLIYYTDIKNKYFLIYDKSLKDHYIPKLFNNMLIENKNTDKNNTDPKKSYNIDELNFIQKQSIELLDRTERLSNINKDEMFFIDHLLKKLNNTSYLFIDQFIKKTNVWIQDTKSNFNHIYTDSKDINKELSTIKLDKTIKHSKELINKLNNSLGDITLKMSKFKQTSKTIKSNLEFAHKIQKNSKELPELLKKYIKLESTKQKDNFKIYGYIAGIIGIFFGIIIYVLIYYVNKILKKQVY